jgi:hypothetical protein
MLKESLDPVSDDVHLGASLSTLSRTVLKTDDEPCSNFFNLYFGFRPFNKQVQR